MLHKILTERISRHKIMCDVLKNVECRYSRLILSLQIYKNYVEKRGSRNYSITCAYKYITNVLGLRK